MRLRGCFEKLGVPEKFLGSKSWWCEGFAPQEVWDSEKPRPSPNTKSVEQRLLLRIQAGHRADFFFGRFVALGAVRVFHRQEHPVALVLRRPAERKHVRFVPSNLIRHRAHQDGKNFLRHVFYWLPAPCKQVFRRHACHGLLAPPFPCVTGPVVHAPPQSDHRHQSETRARSDQPYTLRLFQEFYKLSYRRRLTCLGELRQG